MGLLEPSRAGLRGRDDSGSEGSPPRRGLLYPKCLILKVKMSLRHNGRTIILLYSSLLAVVTKSPRTPEAEAEATASNSKHYLRSLLTKLE